jgi:ATP-dependent protease ClpP protease subunit
MLTLPSNVDTLRTVWRAANAVDPDDANTGWSLSNEDRPRVYVFGMIGGWRMNVENIVRAIHAIKAPAIDLHVNSPGGFVWDAVAMYEAFKSHPATVTAHIDGLAASAASFLVQAADDRIMAVGSRMIIHDAQGGGYGSPADVQAAADLLTAVSDDIASIYAERAGGKPGAWRKAMSATTAYSASQAVDAGLADRVATTSTPGPDNRTRLIQARHRALTTQGG